MTGGLVALTDAPVDTRGRVLDVSDDGRTVEILWELRHVHESEEGMATV